MKKHLLRSWMISSLWFSFHWAEIFTCIVIFSFISSSCNAGVFRQARRAGRVPFHVQFGATSFHLSFTCCGCQSHSFEPVNCFCSLLNCVFGSAHKAGVFLMRVNDEWDDHRLTGVCQHDSALPPPTFLHISHLPACFCVTLLKLWQWISQGWNFWWIVFFSVVLLRLFCVTTTVSI